MDKIEILKLDHFGRGIGYINQKVVFVENALPNEVVEVDIVEEKKQYCIGKVKKYIETSEKRMKPFCTYYNCCGGCKLEHMSYVNSVQFKKEKIQNIFDQAKITLPEIQVLLNEHPKNYRNKLSLHIVNQKYGFFEEKSHRFIEIKSCFLAQPAINQFLKQVFKLNVKNGSMIIRTNYNEELLIHLKTKDPVTFHPEDFVDCKIVGVILNKKTIYGDHFFYERVNGYLFKVSYDAFFQINPYITAKLFSTIEEKLLSNGRVLDLYSGVGTLGIIASKKAEMVYSVEIIKNAVLDNIENKKLNQKENIQVFLGKAEEVLKKIKIDFDTILIDPPRKGLDKSSLPILLNSHAKQIIYISCDPMTLVRDIKFLKQKYTIEEYYLLDMFSYTYHVESICILKRKQERLGK